MLANLRPRLQPGDVLLVRDDSRLTAAILPGFWTHAALFLGGRPDLEVLGLNSHPHVVRHWHEIPENCGPLGLVIEALFPCVQLNPVEKCLRVDHFVVLRPTLPASDIASAIGEALGHLGKPYDFEFDFNNSSRIVCTELVYRSYHNRGAMTFSLTKRLGRFTLTGDDIIAHALDSLGESGETKLGPVSACGVGVETTGRPAPCSGAGTNTASAAPHSPGLAASATDESPPVNEPRSVRKQIAMRLATALPSNYNS